MQILNENMLVLIEYKSFEESRWCTNTIVASLGLRVVSKLFEDEQNSKCGLVILGIFICLDNIHISSKFELDIFCLVFCVFMS